MANCCETYSLLSVACAWADSALGIVLLTNMRQADVLRLRSISNGVAFVEREVVIAARLGERRTTNLILISKGTPQSSITC